MQFNNQAAGNEFAKKVIFYLLPKSKAHQHLGSFRFKDIPVEHSSQCKQICPHCHLYVNATPFGCLGGFGGAGGRLHFSKALAYICWFKNLSGQQFFIFYCMYCNKILLKHLKS